MCFGWQRKTCCHHIVVDYIQGVVNTTSWFIFLFSPHFLFNDPMCFQTPCFTSRGQLLPMPYYNMCVMFSHPSLPELMLFPHYWLMDHFSVFCFLFPLIVPPFSNTLPYPLIHTYI